MVRALQPMRHLSLCRCAAGDGLRGGGALRGGRLFAVLRGMAKNGILPRCQSWSTCQAASTQRCDSVQMSRLMEQLQLGRAKAVLTREVAQ